MSKIQHNDGLGEVVEALDDYVAAYLARKTFHRSGGAYDILPEESSKEAWDLRRVEQNTLAALLAAYEKLAVTSKPERAYHTLNLRDYTRSREERMLNHIALLANRLRPIRATTPEGEHILHDLCSALNSLEIIRREEK